MERNLGELPSGRQTVAGVEFDVRGIIQLSGDALNKILGATYPTGVRGIRVDHKCRKLHFLHGTGWRVRDGQSIGRYTIHYYDETSVDIPLVYGENIADWWYVPGEDASALSGVVAWKGYNDAVRAQGQALRLYMLTWDNPRPEAAITRIDFFSEGSNSSPFLIALTIQ